MRKDFRLEELEDFDSYERLCDKAGVEPGSDDGFESKRFYRIRRGISYRGFRGLLMGVYDDFNLSHLCLIKGREFGGIVPLMKPESRRAYFKEILKREEECERIALYFVSNIFRRRIRNRPRDEFEFVRKGKLWILKRLRVRKANFGMYEFEGLTETSPHLVDAVGGIV